MHWCSSQFVSGILIDVLDPNSKASKCPPPRLWLKVFYLTPHLILCMRFFTLCVRFTIAISVLHPVVGFIFIQVTSLRVLCIYSLLVLNYILYLENLYLKVNCLTLKCLLYLLSWSCLFTSPQPSPSHSLCLNCATLNLFSTPDLLQGRNFATC